MWKTLTVSIFALFFLVSCGKDEAPPQQPPAPPVTVEGLKTADGKFLVEPDVKTYQVGSFKARYQVKQSSDKSLVDTKTLELEVKYRMPSMPAMKIPPADVTALDNGVYEVEYFFAHGGDWQIELSFVSGGNLVDKLTLDFVMDSNHSRSFVETNGSLKSSKGLFTLTPDVQHYSSGSVTVNYAVTDSSGNPLDLSANTIEVKYGMPNMPGMMIPPAKVSVTGLGQLRVKYFFAHGGKWRKVFRLIRGGSEVDQIVYDFLITH